MRFESRFTIGNDQYLISGRYLVNNGEILLGWPVVIPAIVETLQIALIGTVGAILVSLPFALLAARNVSPHPTVYQVTRVLLNANRAIPELIFALIFVVAVGLGPFAGVLALVIGSIGALGKLYAESIEAIDPQQVLAVRATGAPRLHIFNYAVIPQAFPNMASYSLLLFESNVRAATILGIVGAGGVGFIIQKYLALFQYQEMIGATLIIIIVVTFIDRISDYVRKRII
jgi:phosphonate transport system permease protein